MAGILPAGLAGYVAAEQQSRQGGAANLQQALGILNAQHQIAQQEQEEQTNPLRLGILRAQLDKTNADLALQRDATAGLSGVNISEMDPDRLRAVGLRLGLGGHPGAAGVLAAADKVEQSKLHRTAINGLQEQFTPVPAAPVGTELAGPPAASGEATSAGMSQVPGVSGILAAGSSPAPGDIQRMVEMDRAGVPFSMKQPNPQALALNLANAKVPAPIAAQMLPPTPYEQGRLEIARNKAGTEIPKAPANYRWTPDGKALEYIPGGPADPANKAPGIAGGGALDPDAIKLVAEQYLAGDPRAAQGYARSPATKAAITNEIARQAKEQGIDGKLLSAISAEFEGFRSGQRVLGTREAQLSVAADVTSKFVPIAIEASEKFDRTPWKSINDIQIAVDNRTASPELRRFAAANNALVNVYARAINPQGAATVSDKEHAREILNTAFSKGDYRAGAEQLKREVDTELAAPTDVKADYRSRFTGGSRPSAPAPAGRSIFDQADAILNRR